MKETSEVDPTGTPAQSLKKSGVSSSLWNTEEVSEGFSKEFYR